MYVAGVGERNVVCRVLVGNSERKREPGTPRRRCEDNIKMDLQEVLWSMEEIDLA